MQTASKTCTILHRRAVHHASYRVSYHVSSDQVSVSYRFIPLRNVKPGHRSGLGLGLRREVRKVWGPIVVRIAKGFLRDAERLVGYGVRHSYGLPMDS